MRTPEPVKAEESKERMSKYGVPLSEDDEQFLSKMDKKTRKETLRDLKGEEPKNRSRFGKNYFKKNTHVID